MSHLNSPHLHSSVRVKSIARIVHMKGVGTFFGFDESSTLPPIRVNVFLSAAAIYFSSRVLQSRKASMATGHSSFMLLFRCWGIQRFQVPYQVCRNLCVAGRLTGRLRADTQGANTFYRLLHLARSSLL